MTHQEDQEKRERPAGNWWVQLPSGNWEREVEYPDAPCKCGCSTFVESTYDWPRCVNCRRA